MRKSFLVITLSIFTLLSCKEDPAVPSVNCSDDLGTFDLLQSSIDSMPYKGVSRVIFVDTFQNEISFSISRQEDPAIQVKMTYPEEYCYTTHLLRYELFNESEGITLTLSLTATPTRYSSTELYVSDDLYISYRDSSPKDFAFGVFNKTIDYRGSPQPVRQNKKFESIVILGKSFLKVEQTEFIIPTNWLLFNYTEGIVAFEDDFNNKWRFDRFE